MVNINKESIVTCVDQTWDQINDLQALGANAQPTRRIPTIQEVKIGAASIRMLGTRHKDYLSYI